MKFSSNNTHGMTCTHCTCCTMILVSCVKTIQNVNKLILLNNEIELDQKMACQSYYSSVVIHIYKYQFNLQLHQWSKKSMVELWYDMYGVYMSYHIFPAMSYYYPEKMADILLLVTEIDNLLWAVIFLKNFNHFLNI